MNNYSTEHGILSKLINEIGEENVEVRAERYTMVNVRPGDKVAAMLDILTKLSGKSASVLVADEIARRLAKYAASSARNAEAILDAVEKASQQDDTFHYQDGSALDLLQKAGILEIVKHSICCDYWDDIPF